jgi:hypothetical protein
VAKYLISAINVADGEVREALVHSLVRGAEPGDFGLDVGAPMPHAEIANLVATDEVYVVRDFIEGGFDFGSRVSRKAGANEFLVSVDADGRPNGDLFNLTRYSVEPEVDE